MATIKEKILEDHKRIMSETDPDVQEQLADDVGKLAAQAIKHGMKSSAWAIYMSRYAENTDQLKRLCGEDEVFNQNPWSERCLAYIVGNPICTIMTRRNDTGGNMNEGTLNYMDSQMKNSLDF